MIINRFEKQTVDNIFANAKKIDEIILGLYETVIPGFNSKEHKIMTDGVFPIIHPETDKYIEMMADKWIKKQLRYSQQDWEWIWFDYGFTVDERIPEWAADISKVKYASKY